MQTLGEVEADSSLEDVERAKYERVWAIEKYARTSPAYHRYFSEVKRVVGKSQKVIEFGCGAGYALKYFEDLGHEVLGVDIAENCLRVDVPFKQACLWHPMDVSGDVGFCVDVLEHIPTSKVKDTIGQIMQCVPKCLFIACMLPDSIGSRQEFGKDTLHLTVRSASWWRNLAKECGEVVDFSDDKRSAIFTLI